MMRFGEELLVNSDIEYILHVPKKEEQEQVFIHKRIFWYKQTTHRTPSVEEHWDIVFKNNIHVRVWAKDNGAVGQIAGDGFLTLYAPEYTEMMRRIMDGED